MSKILTLLNKYGSAEITKENYVKDTLHVGRGYTFNYIMRHNECSYLEIYKNGVCIVRFINSSKKVLNKGLELKKTFDDLELMEDVFDDIYRLLDALYVQYQHMVIYEYNRL